MKVDKKIAELVAHFSAQRQKAAEDIEECKRELDELDTQAENIKDRVQSLSEKRHNFDVILARLKDSAPVQTADEDEKPDEEPVKQRYCVLRETILRVLKGRVMSPSDVQHAVVRLLNRNVKKPAIASHLYEMKNKCEVCQPKRGLYTIK